MEISPKRSPLVYDRMKAATKDYMQDFKRYLSIILSSLPISPRRSRIGLLCAGSGSEGWVDSRLLYPIVLTGVTLPQYVQKTQFSTSRKQKLKPDEIRFQGASRYRTVIGQYGIIEAMYSSTRPVHTKRSTATWYTTRASTLHRQAQLVGMEGHCRKCCHYGYLFPPS